MRKLPAYVIVLVLLAACAQRSNLDAIGEKVEEYGQDRIATPVMQAARMREALPLLDEAADGSSRAVALASQMRVFIRDTLEKAPDWGLASLRTLAIGEKVAMLEGSVSEAPASWLNARFAPLFDLAAAKERCSRLRLEIPAMDTPALDEVDAVSGDLESLRAHAFAECSEIILAATASGGLIVAGPAARLREMKRTVEEAAAEADALRPAFEGKLSAVRNSALVPVSASVTFTRGMNILFFDVAPKESVTVLAGLPAEAFVMSSESVSLPVSSVTAQGGRLRVVVSGENLPGSYFGGEGTDARLSLKYGDSANEGCSLRLCPATISSAVGAVVEEISPVSASVRAVLPSGSVDEWGLCYSKGTILCNEYVKGPAGGDRLLLQPLEPGAHYWFKVYTIVSGEVAYSDMGDFSTLSLESMVRIASVRDVTFCTAAVHGITEAAISATWDYRCGLCYVAGDALPTLDDKVAEAAAGAGEWTVSLSALVPGTLYTCRSFVQAAGHVAYGGPVTVMTAPCPDLVFTDAAADVSYLEASLNGRLYNVPEAVTSKIVGFIYGTSPALEDSSLKYAAELAPDGSFSVGLGSLDHSTDYWYKAIAVLDGVRYEGAAVLFHTTDIVLGSGDSVDLGLSVDWASRNLGAAEPWEEGDFYAWGETAPKYSFEWENYAYGGPDAFAKYSSDYKVLDPSDDAASVALGAGWRMPTKAECEELKNNCFVYELHVSGYWGALLVSKKNGNCIFLCNVYSTVENSHVMKVWSSELVYSGRAFVLAVPDGIGIFNDSERFRGLPIRPVKEK